MGGGSSGIPDLFQPLVKGETSRGPFAVAPLRVRDTLAIDARTLPPANIWPPVNRVALMWYDSRCGDFRETKPALCFKSPAIRPFLFWMAAPYNGFGRMEKKATIAQHSRPSEEPRQKSKQYQLITSRIGSHCVWLRPPDVGWVVPSCHPIQLHILLPAQAC